MQFLKALRGKRQQRTVSDNRRNGSGDGHALEIQGSAPHHQPHSNESRRQNLHGSVVHKKCACNIVVQHRYPKKLDLQCACAVGHGFHASFNGDELMSDKLVGRFPCINGISTITTSLEHESAELRAAAVLKNRTKWSTKTDGISFHAGDGEDGDGDGEEIAKLELHHGPKDMPICQVLQKFTECSCSSSSSNAVWPLGYHHCKALHHLHPAADQTATPRYGLKKNITCLVKTIFRWRSPVSAVVSEDGQLSARFAKLFCCDNNKKTRALGRQLSSRDADHHRQQSQDEERRIVSKVGRPVADDSTGDRHHQKTSSQLLQQLSCSHSHSHRGAMKQSRTFPAPAGSQCEYWINTDSDYVVLVINGTTNL